MSTAQQPPPPQPQPPYPGMLTGPGHGPIGEQRKPWKVVVLTFITFGVYGVYWAYRSHEDIKLHIGEGVGGVVGALIYFFAGIITIFLLPLEIKKMYERDGRQSPVSAATAAWILLFAIPWYVKVQRALNDYWAGKGAAPPK